LFLDFPTMQPLAEAYAYLGIDCDRLKAQAVVAKAMFQLHIESSAKSSTPDVLQTLLGMECAFSDLVIFTKLVITIPVSSAGAERSFSAMKRVKMYLCSTMSHNHLWNLCIISIERTMSGKLLTVTGLVVDQFESNGKRRLSLRCEKPDKVCTFSFRLYSLFSNFFCFNVDLWLFVVLVLLKLLYVMSDDVDTFLRSFVNLNYKPIALGLLF